MNRLVLLLVFSIVFPFNSKGFNESILELTPKCEGDILFDQGFEGNNNSNAHVSERSFAFVADNFSFAENTSVNDICWWGFNWNQTAEGCTLNDDQNFLLTFYFDNGGAPGDIFAGPVELNYTSETTSYTSPTTFSTQVPIVKYSAQFPVIDITKDQNFWVSIVASNDECRFFWLIKENVGNAHVYFADRWFTFPQEMNFVLGFADNEEANIPTLSQWGFLILSILILNISVLRMRLFSESHLVRFK